jgi:hypothetical protein
VNYVGSFQGTNSESEKVVFGLLSLSAIPIFDIGFVKLEPSV